MHGVLFHSPEDAGKDCIVLLVVKMEACKQLSTAQRLLYICPSIAPWANRPGTVGIARDMLFDSVT